MCWRIRFSASVQLQMAPITASLENVPDSQSSALIGEIIINLFLIIIW